MAQCIALKFQTSSHIKDRYDKAIVENEQEMDSYIKVLTDSMNYYLPC